MNLVSSLMNWIKWPTNSCPYWTTQCTDDQRNSTTGHWNSFCVVLWCNRRHSKSSTKEQTVKVCINQIMWFNVSYSVNVQSMHEFIKFGVRRAPSSDRCCLCCTPPILRRWSPNIVCIPTCMRTIHRFTAGVNRLMSACSKITCQGASTTCGGGCAATDCSWMHWRRSSSGALLHAVIITFLIETYKSGTTLSIRSSQPETLVCMYVDGGVTMRAHINQCCRCVMVHWDSSDRLSSLCHHMHWTHSLPVSYIAGWTTATLFLLVYQLATFNVCSPFLIQPYVWSPAHRDVITWLPCCAIATGFLLSSASNTSCVQLFIVVCTATHHPTWSTSSRHLLLQVPELVWDLLSRWPSQYHACCHHLETALLRPPVHVRGTSYRHTSVWCSLLTLLDVILQHFYFTRSFYHDIVRRPCCAPALTSR